MSDQSTDPTAPPPSPLDLGETVRLALAADMKAAAILVAGIERCTTGRCIGCSESLFALGLLFRVLLEKFAEQPAPKSFTPVLDEDWRGRHPAFQSQSNVPGPLPPIPPAARAALVEVLHATAHGVLDSLKHAVASQPLRHPEATPLIFLNVSNLTLHSCLEPMADAVIKFLDEMAAPVQ